MTYSTIVCILHWMRRLGSSQPLDWVCPLSNGYLGGASSRDSENTKVDGLSIHKWKTKSSVLYAIFIDWGWILDVLFLFCPLTRSALHSVLKEGESQSSLLVWWFFLSHGHKLLFAFLPVPFYCVNALQIKTRSYLPILLALAWSSYMSNWSKQPALKPLDSREKHWGTGSSHNFLLRIKRGYFTVTSSMGALVFQTFPAGVYIFH